MNLKKVIGLILIICIATTMICVVSAQEVTISKEKFNIPDGFKENQSNTLPAQGEFGETLCKVYTNGTASFSINVCEYTGEGEIAYLPMFDEVEKTINNHTGIYNETLGNFHYQGDNGEDIIICCSDLKLLDEIII